MKISSKRRRTKAEIEADKEAAEAEKERVRRLESQVDELFFNKVELEERVIELEGLGPEDSDPDDMN